jgi:hypothetical protein
VVSLILIHLSGKYNCPLQCDVLLFLSQTDLFTFFLPCVCQCESTRQEVLHSCKMRKSSGVAS